MRTPFSTFTHMRMSAIHSDPEILGGTPVFRGTRVPIKNLFDYLETGETIDEFLADFQGVKREQVIEVLELSESLAAKTVLNEDTPR